VPRQSPHRLRGFDYLGFHRYFLTFCTHARQRYFARAEMVDCVRTEFVRAAQLHDIAVIAYCFMPDHVHLLIEGTSESADAKRFIVAAKQFSGYACRPLCANRLWQRYGYERILRSDEDAFAVARYILENPLRAGLAREPQEYAFSGSLTHTVREIITWSCAWHPPG
jgi:putative transposase